MRLISNAKMYDVYRAEKKSMQILLSSTQAGPGRKVKQEQEEISRNHVPRLFLGSVLHTLSGADMTIRMDSSGCSSNLPSKSGLESFNLN